MYIYIYLYIIYVIVYVYNMCIYIYIICIYCICVERLMTRITFQAANWFVFRMQRLWTIFFPATALIAWTCWNMLGMYGNVVYGFETLWSICFLQSNTSTPNPMQSKSLKPQNRYIKYGFLNCLCQYAIFCSWFSFFVCTYGDTVNRSTNMLHVAIFIQWFDNTYIYTLDIQTPSAKVFGKSGPYKHIPKKPRRWLDVCLGMRLKESKGVMPWHGWGSEGPFDVILGFSEGASCAAVLLAAIQGVSRILEPRNHTTTTKTQALPFAYIHYKGCVIWLVWKILLGILELNCEAWKKHNVFRMKTKWLRSHWL